MKGPLGGYLYRVNLSGLRRSLAKRCPSPPCPAPHGPRQFSSCGAARGGEDRRRVNRCREEAVDTVAQSAVMLRLCGGSGMTRTGIGSLAEHHRIEPPRERA
ncbi:hypothetical protein pipiens_015813 [Culex pipiens pipiens]|uniref:Uncharacterized protein n=1 Tax=Culex pipiens pipiens TaxID=38569 RepID=A0ABD1CNY2_CULPP